MPRRRPGALLPLEVGILVACLEAGDAGSHGFALAKAIADAGDSRQLTATGTMYRALHRLEAAGLVESWWEDPNDAADAGRPRRRSYRITGAGTAALARARNEATDCLAHSSRSRVRDMNDRQDDRSTRIARWWVRRYTAGLPNYESVSRRAEIDSDLAEHAQHRELDSWTPKQIMRERLRRLVGGMAADLSWRHELVTGHCNVRRVLQVSVMSVTSLAAITLSLFHFVFAAYMLGNTSLADQRSLGGLDNYAAEVDRPVASVIAALIIAGLGVVLLAASLARPVSPVIANAATMAIAVLAVLWFWLGVWPVALVAVLGSTVDLATRTPNPTPQL